LSLQEHLEESFLKRDLEVSFLHIYVITVSTVNTENTLHFLFDILISVIEILFGV